MIGLAGGRDELLVNAGEVGVDLHDIIMTSLTASVKCQPIVTVI
jgi:hypothetical protein